jgi:hypothetical protein
MYHRAVLCQRAQALISELAELEILRDRVQEAEEIAFLRQSADPVKSSIHECTATDQAKRAALRLNEHKAADRMISGFLP